MREVFEYFKALITKDDLLALAEGSLYRENIINVYFKILEKFNLILQQSYNFQRATTRYSVETPEDQTTNKQPSKILYFNTNFHRKLNSEVYIRDCVSLLRDYFRYD